MMRAATLALGLLLPAAAGAQERPNIFPTRDVAVTYRLTTGQGAPQVLTMAWQAVTRRVRLDMPGLGFMVADQDRNRGFLAMEQQRILVELPVAQAMAQHGPSEAARFTRLGQDRVAGHACTRWRYEDRGNAGEACLTPDGVMLRGRGAAPGGQQGALEAVELRYAAQDPARFERPQGWASMPMPGQMPGGAPPRR